MKSRIDALGFAAPLPLALTVVGLVVAVVNLAVVASSIPLHKVWSQVQVSVTMPLKVCAEHPDSAEDPSPHPPDTSKILPSLATEYK